MDAIVSTLLGFFIFFGGSIFICFVLFLFHRNVHGAPKRTDLNGEEPKAGTTPYRTRENIDYLYGKQRGHCAGCGNHYRDKDLALDHIVPRAAGGSDELDNLQLLCTACNSTKGTGTMQDLHYRLAKQEKERLATLGLEP